jgi:hypothetical protein
MNELHKLESMTFQNLHKVIRSEEEICRLKSHRQSKERTFKNNLKEKYKDDTQKISNFPSIKGTSKTFFETLYSK